MKFAMFDAATLAGDTGGKWNRIPSPKISGVETDTRNELDGKLFVALRGERFDAHDFLETAHSKGAFLCINKDRADTVPDGAAALAVDDTLAAYQNMANRHRLRMADLKLLAVTGSVGKTSVKEMLRAVMCEFFGKDHIVATDGNTNNHIGVPRNLLRLSADTSAAVIEMGTSSPGEIAVLSKMAVPDVALVNSIAPCHLEKLIDLAGVAAEKGDIFKFLKTDGTAVIPGDIAETVLLKKSAGGHRIITFGDFESNADVRSRFGGGSLSGSTFKLYMNSACYEITWSLTGRHQCRNAAAAAAAALAMGVPEQVIVSGLKNTVLPGMRGKIISVNGALILNDAYNASPASMTAVLKMFAEAEVSGRAVLLLGTMLELGSESTKEHQNILSLARSLFPSGIIITVGRGFESLSGADHHFSSSSEAADLIAGLCVPGTSILVKGSRGTALEKSLPPEAV